MTKVSHSIRNLWVASSFLPSSALDLQGAAGQIIRHFSPLTRRGPALLRQVCEFQTVSPLWCLSMLHMDKENPQYGHPQSWTSGVMASWGISPSYGTIGSTSRKSLLVNKLNTHSNMELLIPCGCNFAKACPVLISHRDSPELFQASHLPFWVFAKGFKRTGLIYLSSVQGHSGKLWSWFSTKLDFSRYLAFSPLFWRSMFQDLTMHVFLFFCYNITLINVLTNIPPSSLYIGVRFVCWIIDLV